MTTAPIARYTTTPSGPTILASSPGSAKIPGPIIAPMPIITAMNRPISRLNSTRSDIQCAHYKAA